MSTGDCLLLFAKLPRPGTVKTRLGAELGMEAAAAAYRRLTECVLRTLPPDLAVRVCFAPDEAGAEMDAWLRPHLPDAATFHPQGEGDLGQRMARAFAEAFAAGAARVVIIGSDCIDLTPALFAEAFAVLAEVEAVLGPSTDGGYYLLGLRTEEPRVFEGIAWSTERVLEQTVQRVADLGWTHRLLPTLTDVDTVAEWRAVEGRV